MDELSRKFEENETMSDIKESLKQEVSFWQSMLKECPNAGESDCQRMREALLLAEYKLAQMSAKFPDMH